MTAYPLSVLALLFTLLVYVWTVFTVGQARGKFGVPAPATSGNETFERIFRAQQNTTEQLVMFVPLLAVLAMQWGDVAGAVYGAVWGVGRILYTIGYGVEASKRSFGFMLSGGLSMLVLLVCVGTALARLFGA